MPAVSKKQQKFFQMVKAAQSDPKVYKKMPKNIQKVAKNMKKKDVEDFANTKTDNLPDKVKQEQIIRKIVKECILEILSESKK